MEPSKEARKVAVTQGARDAAASVAEHWHHNGREHPRVHYINVVDGLDDDWLLVQAFQQYGDQRVAEAEARIVEWLREGALWPPEKWESAGFKPTLLLRIETAWISFRRPWAFARGGCAKAADAIERREHTTAQSAKEIG